ncbi:MAG: DUF2075 domain-containing protein [Gammaproteobacteria bacterium]|nr:DUF2075 domain-containing protein [Gammaproteobacteria bacterium]
MITRFYYSADLKGFAHENPESILGKLAAHHQHDLDPLQRNAWLKQIEVLKKQLANLESGHIFFEFGIPRMGKRADVVIVHAGIVFVIEFKVGATHYHSGDINQATDYGLDLKHFHEGSHNACIVPILIATQAQDRGNTLTLSDDLLSNCQFANAENLSMLIERCTKELPTQNDIDAISWSTSRYKPTPTIVQAAQALYSGHDVKEISRSDAGAKNLTDTANALRIIIDRSKELRQKSICFVTGVPGAGKTLAGLNITTNRMRSSEDEHAVFLSGNGPLVAVLREALARDEVARKGVTKSVAKQKASAFIQNIHHFRDDNLITETPPVEKVVIFDEAQRAWDRDQTSSFMKQKKGLDGFNQSEPELLIQVMDRHKVWCVIIALIGGGQEINTGEAGLPEWFSALRHHLEEWHVYYSDAMDSDEYIQGGALPAQLEGLTSQSDPGLHLGVLVRSFRAEKLSEFIHYLIANEPEKAGHIFSKISHHYPIAITRNIDKAKAWLRSHVRGNELFGILASSGAGRLKPHGINVKDKIAPEQWFLNGREDVRSCQYLEYIGTEFDVQGLELDWCVVGWDADLRYSQGQWQHYSFRGTKWQAVNKGQRKRYLENAYRVLLTRARQGFVIFIPYGSCDDFTRPPTYYDETFAYLMKYGIPYVE